MSFPILIRISPNLMIELVMFQGSLHIDPSLDS